MMKKLGVDPRQKVFVGCRIGGDDRDRVGLRLKMEREVDGARNIHKGCHASYSWQRLPCNLVWLNVNENDRYAGEQLVMMPRGELKPRVTLHQHEVQLRPAVCML